MTELKYKYKLSDFACKCCGKNLFNLSTFAKLQDAFLSLSWTPPVNSGYRCPAHNLAVGSTAPEHPAGRAVDFGVTEGPRRMFMVSQLLAYGFRRIGIASDFIHVDDYDGPESLWLYPPKGSKKVKIARA